MPDYNTIYAIVGQFIPAQYAATVSFFVMLLLLTCMAASAAWKRPKDGYLWLPIYSVVNLIALNIAHARNADDVQQGDKK